MVPATYPSVGGRLVTMSDRDSVCTVYCDPVTSSLQHSGREAVHVYIHTVNHVFTNSAVGMQMNDCI